MFETIGFVGFGLIGGSIAKSIRKRIPATKLIAFDLDTKSLQEALQDGILDKVAQDLNDGFQSCDLIFLSCPVGVNITMFDRLSRLVNPNSIITDVGSTKGDIHAHVALSGYDHLFIGGHPMTGSEKTGYNNASSRLLENVYYILTPTKTTHPAKLNQLQDLVTALDSIPIIMDAKTHDITTASISHVPHVLAALIVKSVKDLDSPDNYMHTLAAGGFKDITRIASASPIMWQQICLANKEPILSALSHHADLVENVINMIQADQAKDLFQMFDEAKDYRNTFSETTSGLLARDYYISVDVDDEPGIISKISTLLYQAGINIKNIGVVNNREIDKGVLKIQFEDGIHLEKSIILLQALGYTLYL